MSSVEILEFPEDKAYRLSLIDKLKKHLENGNLDGVALYTLKLAQIEGVTKITNKCNNRPSRATVYRLSNEGQMLSMDNMMRLWKVMGITLTLKMDQ